MSSSNPIQPLTSSTIKKYPENSPTFELEPKQTPSKQPQPSQSYTPSSHSSNFQPLTQSYLSSQKYTQKYDQPQPQPSPKIYDSPKNYQDTSNFSRSTREESSFGHSTLETSQSPRDFQFPKPSPISQSQPQPHYQPTPIYQTQPIFSPSHPKTPTQRRNIGTPSLSRTQPKTQYPIEDDISQDDIIESIDQDPRDFSLCIYISAIILILLAVCGHLFLYYFQNLSYCNTITDLQKPITSISNPSSFLEKYFAKYFGCRQCPENATCYGGKAKCPTGYYLSSFGNCVLDENFEREKDRLFSYISEYLSEQNGNYFSFFFFSFSFISKFIKKKKVCMNVMRMDFMILPIRI